MKHPQGIEVSSYLRKAKHALEVAQKLMQDGYDSDAASKIYYALFYASQALLKANNIHVIRHSAVEAALGHQFVKSGEMEARFHRLLIGARRNREIADYDIEEDFGQVHPATSIEEGKRFITEMERLIQLSSEKKKTSTGGNR